MQATRGPKRKLMSPLEKKVELVKRPDTRVVKVREPITQDSISLICDSDKGHHRLRYEKGRTIDLTLAAELEAEQLQIQDMQERHNNCLEYD